MTEEDEVAIETKNNIKKNLEMGVTQKKQQVNIQ